MDKKARLEEIENLLYELKNEYNTIGDDIDHHTRVKIIWGHSYKEEFGDRYEGMTHEEYMEKYSNYGGWFPSTC